MHIVEIALPSGLRLTLDLNPGVWSWRHLGYVVKPETPEEAWQRLIGLLRTTDLNALIKAYSVAPTPVTKERKAIAAPAKEAKISSIRDVVSGLRAQDGTTGKSPVSTPASKLPL